MKRPIHKLRVPPDVAELVSGLHPQIKRKLRAALEQILADPNSGKPLKDDLKGLWSYRVGKFRVIYRVSSRHLDLVAFGPRERIYEETYRLLAKSKETGGVREPRGRYRVKRLPKQTRAQN